MRWQDIPVDSYLADALALSAEERGRLKAALAVLPDSIIDAHTHISRLQDVEHVSADLLGHAVSTFPFYSLEMAEAAKRVLWPGKQLRAARMAHAVTGYRHASINEYLQAELPAADFLIGFGLASAPLDVCRLLSTRGVAALKMYFHSVDPPLRTVAEVFPESVLRAPPRLRACRSSCTCLRRCRMVSTKSAMLPPATRN